MTNFDTALSLVSDLSTLEKIRLMEHIASLLESDLVGLTGEKIESAESTAAVPKTFQELVMWLNANPPDEAWGELADDQEAGEYIHQMRRRATVWLEEPGETE
ncbi:MAG: hypothetical protein HY866_04475 [Chloroflexi bacterium]|nr:hypothetical protein [Chloroflexota bacterium]